MSPVSGVAVDAMAFCEVDFSKFVGVIRSAVVHRSFGGLSFRYIFVLFGMGDFGNISFNGTIDLWDASDIIIWDYRYRYNSLCMVDCPVGHVAEWLSACDDGVAVCGGPYGLVTMVYGMVLCGIVCLGDAFLPLLYPTGTIRTYECDIDFVCLCCKQAILQDPTGNRVL